MTIFFLSHVRLLAFFGQFHAAGSSKSHWRRIQSFVDWVRQDCGTSEVFVLHVLRCALSLASVLVAYAARAETHGCNTGRKTERWCGLRWGRQA